MNSLLNGTEIDKIDEEEINEDEALRILGDLD
jgi:hypothetical protein